MPTRFWRVWGGSIPRTSRIPAISGGEWFADARGTVCDSVRSRPLSLVAEPRQLPSPFPYFMLKVPLPSNRSAGLIVHSKQ